MLQQYLEVGKVTRAHGIMGEVQVQPWADSPEFLCRFKTLYVDKTHWPIQVERARVHKNMVILKLEGVTDVPSALAMRNAILYIDRADAPLPEGQFYLADLYGLEVRDARTGELLGDATSCSMCRRLVINAGLKEVVIRRTATAFDVVDVADWVAEDDLLAPRDADAILDRQ